LSDVARHLTKAVRRRAVSLVLLAIMLGAAPRMGSTIVLAVGPGLRLAMLIFAAPVPTVGVTAWSAGIATFHQVPPGPGTAANGPYLKSVGVPKS
jgi:hypothetical protein